MVIAVPANASWKIKNVGPVTELSMIHGRSWRAKRFHPMIELPSPNMKANPTRKNAMLAADHPSGPDVVKRKAREAFLSKAHLRDEREIRKAVGQGRYACREMIALIQLKRYRAMKKRYGAKEGG